MAEAKPWDAVFSRVQARRRVGEVYSPRLTDADLAASFPGMPLPPSYRAFAFQFGLNGGLWPVDLLSLECDSESARLHGARGTVVGETAFLRKNANRLGRSFADLMDRCVCFSSGGNRVETARRIYVWDPDGVTAGGEWPIYEVERVSEYGALVVSHALWFASSFHQFVQRIAPPEPDAILYYPRPQRHRHKPGKFNAEKWLMANNGTARAVALSIRNEGRADAFPILADALQDAGCAHADLLDACRTGDPDIDGRWVLQVLLGAG